MDKKVIKLLKELVELQRISEKEQMAILEEWCEYNEHNKISEKMDNYYEQKLHNVDGYGNTYYKEYYNVIHGYMSDKEIDKLNEKIGYNFMSLKFINEIERGI